MKTCFPFTLALVLCLSPFENGNAIGFRDAFGPLFNGTQSTSTNQAPKKALDSVHRWNTIAINASGLDHTPVELGETRVFGEQLGPGRASRAMAIVHIAIFDAVNAIVRRYQSYTGVQAARGPLSLDVAVAEAPHDTLVALYPSQ